MSSYFHSEIMGILEKIQEIEKEIARTQKNKGRADCAFKLVDDTTILSRLKQIQSQEDLDSVVLSDCLDLLILFISSPALWMGRVHFHNHSTPVFLFLVTHHAHTHTHTLAWCVYVSCVDL